MITKKVYTYLYNSIKRIFICLSFLHLVLLYSCSSESNIETEDDAILITSLEHFYSIFYSEQNSSSMQEDSLGVEITNIVDSNNLMRQYRNVRAQLIERIVSGYSDLALYSSDKNYMIYVSDIQTADKIGIKANQKYYVHKYQALNTMSYPSSYSVIMRESVQMGLIMNSNDFDFLYAVKGFRLYYRPEDNRYSMITSLIELSPVGSPNQKYWYPAKPASLEFLFYILVP